jgi:MSHA pilin protein MshC
VHKARHAAGFTAVELVVVMLVAGILAAVAIPRWVDRSVLVERGVSDRLKSVLRQARSLAVAHQRDVCVIVASPQTRVVYTSAGACNAALPVADPAGGGPLLVDVPASVALAGAPLVRFDATGRPVPAASRTVNVGALTLTVSRETGSVL